jgi:hypothetical protein
VTRSTRARPGTTLHYAVYAHGSDGVLVKAGKTTIRLPHSIPGIR